MNRTKLLTLVSVGFFASAACAITRPIGAWNDNWVQDQKIELPHHSSVHDIALEQFITEGRFNLPVKEIHFSYSPSEDGGVKNITTLYSLINSNVEILGLGNSSAIQSEAIANSIALHSKNNPSAAVKNFTLLHQENTFSFQSGKFEFTRK